MGEALLLGLLQGVFEWLPVSSEGMVVLAHSLVFEGEVATGIDYALWLHIGTAPAALVVFRGEATGIVRDVLARPTKLSPLTAFLFISTLVSGIIGLPLLLFLTEIAAGLGYVAMVVVGTALLVTGALQLRRPSVGVRTKADLSALDGLLTGATQGLSVIPGLSRSGLTVAMLLWRNVDRREALVVSFLMSVPASLGAAAYAWMSGSFSVSGETLAATAVAFVTGLVTIRALVAVAERANFGAFLLVAGAAIVAGALLLTLGPSAG